MKVYFNLQLAMLSAFETLANTGRVVTQDNWQGKKAPMPMFEALDVDFKALMPQDRDRAVDIIKPNQVWADDHFKERIGGIPLNPPPSHLIWPHSQNTNQDFQDNGKFDHTYPERFWPKKAGHDEVWDKLEPINYSKSSIEDNCGIRFEYGDLKDVIVKLTQDPQTRQAYLPIWFPEDTGKPGNIRVPCSLGYHFMIREGRLDIKYIMRSTDMLRHFQDDIYLCYLLAHHVFHVLKDNEGVKLENLGYMSFLTFSAHIFDQEVKLLERKIKEWKNQ